MSLKPLIIVVVALCAVPTIGLSPAVSLAQTDRATPPLTTTQTHGVTVMHGIQVVYGRTPNSRSGLVFRTNDLPEGKPVTMVADLMRFPTVKQMSLFAQQDPDRRAKVTCDTVVVTTVRNAQTGRSVSRGHGKDCRLDVLY